MFAPFLMLYGLTMTILETFDVVGHVLRLPLTAAVGILGWCARSVVL